MAARSKQLIAWNAQDINIDPSTSRIKMLELFLVPKKEARCEFVEGETLEEAGTKLALKLGQDKLI
jgi:electron transfer flavoprotein alpha/beta subunit